MFTREKSYFPRFLLPVCRLSWFLYTFNIYAHFSSHFSQQLLMAEIWYLVTSFILVPHIVWSVFGPFRFLLPVCRLCWFLYTLNICAHFSWHYMLIFRRISQSNYWWQESDIWSQASYRCAVSWKAFFDFLFADLVGFYTHWTYMRWYHKWALAHSSSCYDWQTIKTRKCLQIYVCTITCILYCIWHYHNYCTNIYLKTSSFNSLSVIKIHNK